MKRLLQYIYCVYALLVFILLMFLVLPFVFLSLLLGKIKGGNAIYQVCRYWALAWYAFTGIRHKDIYETPHNTKRQYVFVANHISYIDIPAIMLAIRQPYRVLGKYEMVKYPVFGWIYRAAVILVDRKDAEARAKSFRALKAAINQGISIFIFPEGTFNETGKPLKEFYDGAFRLAIEMQTPIQPLLFIDTIDRMHYRGFFELTPGLNRIVHLDTIEVAGLTKVDIPQLKQQVHEVMEQGLRRYRQYH